jgi:hypothetical protein
MNMHEAKIANAPAVFVLMTRSHSKTAVSPLPYRSLCLRRHATQRCGGALHRPITYKENDPFNEIGNVPLNAITNAAGAASCADKLAAGGHLAALDFGDWSSHGCPRGFNAEAVSKLLPGRAAG